MNGTMNDEQQDNLHVIEKYYRSAIDSIKKESNGVTPKNEEFGVGI
jgi:hypothetical protein